MNKYRPQDNHNPSAKLALRRRLLAQHRGEIRVLDCCQGEMRLWEKLRAEFPVTDYLGVDQKPKPGRLNINSVRLLDAPGWKWNVIDIDTYGLPWKHWHALLQHLSHPATVFMTIGRITQTNADTSMLDTAGLRFEKLRIPDSFGRKLIPLLEAITLSDGLRKFLIRNALECINPQEYTCSLTRYIGLQLEPKKQTT